MPDSPETMLSRCLSTVFREEGLVGTISPNFYPAYEKDEHRPRIVQTQTHKR
jgi:hypothetical protein